MASNIADALAYQQQRRQALGTADAALSDLFGNQPMKSEQNLSASNYLENLSSGFGQGFENQLEGNYQLARHPIDSAKAIYQAGKQTIQDPSIIAKALKSYGQRATSGPLGLGETVGEFVNPRSFIPKPMMKDLYLPTRPRMPEQVGKRFATTDVGNLLPEIPFNIEDYKGASIGVIPWDNSSRNKLITNVSDVELRYPVLTHGGQSYARDIAHQLRNIAGASAPKIVQKIADRVKNARQENLAKGGTGVILQTPITMGEFSENYSVTPSQVLLDLIDQKNPSKAKLKGINRSVMDEFPDFAGIETPLGRAQLMGQTESVSAPGQLRKAFVNALYKEDNEKYFGFNRQDISNAISDPELIGVDRGYGMKTVISHGEDPLTLSKSTNESYPVDFSGKYIGTAGNIPVKEFMPGAYANIFKELSGRTDKNGRLIGPSAVADQTIGALSTRAKNVFQFIDDPLIEAIIKRQEMAARRGM